MTAPRARLLLWLSAAILVCLTAYLARHALLPFAIGALGAYALAPLVERMTWLVPLHTPAHAKWRRGIAVMIVYVVFLGLIIATLVGLVPIAARQITHFIDILPAITTSAREQTFGLLEQYQSRTPPEIQDRLERIAEQGAATVGTVLGRALQGTVATVTTTLGFVLGFAVVPFWTFYVMRDRDSVSRSLVEGAPLEVREDARRMLTLMDRLLGRYLRAQLFLGLVVGVAVGAVMALLKVDLSLGLGVWAGVTELIPIIGPWIGAIPALIIVAATDPGLLPWVALTYLLVQQLENNLLVPRFQGEALDMHPAIVILVLVAGGAVWGLIGLVIAVPAAAILRELFWYLDRRLRGWTPDAAFGASHLVDAPREVPGAAPAPTPDPAEATPLD